MMYTVFCEWYFCPKNEHSGSADDRRESGPDLESVSGVRIWTLDMDEFRDFIGDFLSKDLSMIKFS